MNRRQFTSLLLATLASKGLGMDDLKNVGNGTDKPEALANERDFVPSTIREIYISTVPMQEQRYNTVGDWYFAEGKLIISVSDTGDWKQNMCLALHEFVEACLCTAATPQVTPAMVDSFDFAWTQPGAKHLPEFEEPGDDVNAPYHLQHRVATQLEMDFFEEFLPRTDGVKDRHAAWLSYEDKLDDMTAEWDAKHVKGDKK